MRTSGRLEGGLTQLNSPNVTSILPPVAPRSVIRVLIALIFTGRSAHRGKGARQAPVQTDPRNWVGASGGGAVSAGVAVALTTALGEAYISVLKNFATSNPDHPPTAGEIAKALEDKLRGGGDDPVPA